MGKKAIIIPLVIVGVLGAIGGTFYGCFYDGKQVAYKGDDNFNQKTFMQNKLVHSFDNTKTDKFADFKVEESDLNNIFYTASRSFPENANKYVKGITIDITDENYIFNISLEVPMFKTNVKLITKLSDHMDEKNPLDGYYQFDIIETKVGRIKGLDNAAIKLGGKYINDDTISSTLGSKGIHLTSDIKNKKFIYKKAALLSDLSSLLSSTSKLGSAVLQTAFTNNLLELNPNANEALDIKILLEKFNASKTITATRDTLLLKNDIGVYRDKIITLLNNGIINHEDEAIDDELSNMMFFLLEGYDRCSSSVQNYVKNLDLTSIGISDPQTYHTDADLGTKTYIDKAISDQFTLEGIASGQLASLTETDLGLAIMQSGVFGYSYILHTKNDDNSYTVNYITIDNAFCDIMDGTMTLTVGLNINGYPTYLVLDTKASDLQNYKMNFTIEQSALGSVPVVDEMKDYIYNMMEKSLDGENSLSFNASTGVITLDMGKAITGSSFSSLFTDSSLVHATLYGKDLDDTGRINFTLGKKS